MESILEKESAEAELQRQKGEEGQKGEEEMKPCRGIGIDTSCLVHMHKPKSYR